MHALLYFQEVLFCLNRNRRGAVATEYAFLIAFVAIIAALGMVLLGTELNDYFITLGNAIGTSARQS